MSVTFARPRLRWLAWIGRRGTAALAVGALLGLAVPGLANLLAPALPALVFAFLASTLLRLRFDGLRQCFRRPLLPALLIAWSLVLSPAALALVLRATPPQLLPGELPDALMLWAASPPMTAAAAFAALLGLDVELAFGVSLVSTLATPLTAPPLLFGLAGFAVGIDGVALSARLAAVVGGAAAVAWALRRMLGEERLERHGDEIGGAMILVLVAFAAALMTEMRARLATAPDTALTFIAVAFASNLLVQGATAACFAWAGRRRAATAALLGGNRNLSVVYAGLGAAATPDITLFFAAVHLPIYMLPLLLRRIYSAGRGAVAADKAEAAAEAELKPPAAPRPSRRGRAGRRRGSSCGT